MKITVTGSSATVPALLSAADLATISNLIASGTPITLSLKNNQSGQILYVETLNVTAATATSYPVAYGSSIQFVVTSLEGLASIACIGSTASVDTRVLVNALQLNQ